MLAEGRVESDGVMGASSPIRRSRPASAVDGMSPPGWVRSLVAELPRREGAAPFPGARLWLSAGDTLALVSLEQPGAAKLDEEEFAVAVEESYVALARELRARSLRPLRFWNLLPEIGATWPGGLSGYEVFNRARASAFQRPEIATLGEWGRVAASAVDPRTGGLAIHVLAGARPAVPIENPRQIEPHEYSARYGPVPPRFARGVALPAEVFGHDDLPAALVSGTASIVGEETQHAGDLAAQLEEVAVNLASVVLALHGRATPRPSGSRLDDDLRAALREYGDLRAYLPERVGEPALRDWIEELFDLDRPAEVVPADLCRPDLLVEVEGTVRRIGASCEPAQRSSARHRPVRPS